MYITCLLLLTCFLSLETQSASGNSVCEQDAYPRLTHLSRICCDNSYRRAHKMKGLGAKFQNGTEMENLSAFEGQEDPASIDSSARRFRCRCGCFGKPEETSPSF